MSAPSRAPAGTPEGGRFAPGPHAETDVSLSPGTTAPPATPEQLSAAMDFDHPIRVNADGTISDAPGTYAPSLDSEDLDSDEWELLTLPTDSSVGIPLPRLGCLGGYHAATAVGPRYAGLCRTTPSDVGSGGSRRCLIRATERREGRTWPRRLGRATAVSDAGNHSMS